VLAAGGAIDDEDTAGRGGVVMPPLRFLERAMRFQPFDREVV
jgi:hypothetical protein